MTPADARWEAIKTAVAGALELPPEDRAAFLTEAVVDPDALGEASRLLAACDAASGDALLAMSAAELAAPILAEVTDLEAQLPAELRAALSGRYTIDREVGRGGMATVYLARDERHGRLVALKLLSPDLNLGSGATSAAARFQREIEFAARLSHPHILPLYDSGAVGELLYYITPYVDGETLRERLRREGRLPTRESLRVLRDVARALAFAHREGVLHRDIKPANILLNRDGDALLGDFGVAKGLAAAQGSFPRTDAELTDAALVLGTPAYMAPEQVTGDPSIDHRADLYALGAVAYELLTGAAPFAGRPGYAQLAAHLSEVPEPLTAQSRDVPRSLADLVNRLLEKRPDDRPADATEVLAVLEAALEAPARSARWQRGARLRRVRRGLLGMPAIAVVLSLSSASSVEEDPGLDTAMVEGSERGTADPEAYDLYLRGRRLVDTRQRDGLLRALAHFEQAVDRDSMYAQAWAGIADAWTFLGIFGHVSPREAIPSARAAGERAVAIDSLLVEGHATLAHLLFVFEWRWAEAERALEHAIALNPEYPLLRMYYASFLHSVGRAEEALAQLAVATEIDPLTPTGVLSGRIYVDVGRPEPAVRVLEREIELDPRRDLAHQLLAHAYLQLDRPAEAIASMQRAAALSGARDRAQLAYVYARVGASQEARQVLESLLRTGEPLERLGFHLAMAYSALGERDEAFRWLEAGYEEHAASMNLLAVSAGFESLRSDPRFADLLRRMGLL